ncbi:MAG TPA: hypothetical protein VE818_13830 [Nitrososphaeraceae archaeon]|nr:hypothetical protein [Nitrososphaeraceae archaeon]
MTPTKSKENERKSKEFEEEIVVVKEYEERIDKLSLQFRVASENGLFSQEKVSNIIADDILQCLLNARHELIDNHLLACERNLIEAERYYHVAIYGASSWWRFVNAYAFHLWIYFIGMLFSIVSFYFLLTWELPSEQLGFELLAMQAVIWGMIGGLFQDIWYLWRHVQNRDYRNTWMIQYFSAPFIGGILGAIVYVSIIAGLVILDTDTEGKPRDFVVMALAAFAGYNWNWAIERFKSIGHRF